MLLNVYVLPIMVSPDEMAGDTVVVIDVLRATTTITHALAAGAIEVRPCLEIADALREAESLDGSNAILGGERGGLPIDGFHLSNSPDDYTPDTVGGKTLVFTTTNGTKAMRRCGQASEVLLAAFVNVSKVVERLVDRERVHIICAGTNGQYSMDDLLLAGMLVERLERTSGMRFQMNAQAINAKETWCSTFAIPYAIGAEPLPVQLLADRLRESLGGKNLVKLGLDRDIVTAATVDSQEVVPTLDPADFRIRAS